MRTIVQNISGTFDEITEFVPLNYKSGKIILCERMFHMKLITLFLHKFFDKKKKEEGEIHKMSKKFTYFSFAYDLDIMFSQHEEIKSILISISAILCILFPLHIYYRQIYLRSILRLTL